MKPASADALVSSLASAGVQPLGPEPILVVDADPTTRKVVLAMLREHGFRPVCVPGPEEALRAAAAEPPALVLLDLGIPGMAGFELPSRFRQLPSCQNVPLVVWTARDLNSSEREALRRTASSVVSTSEGNLNSLLSELKPLLTGPLGA